MTQWFGLLACLATLAYCSAAELACPEPAGFIAITQREELACSNDTDCQAGELCCQWFSSKHCLAGIDTTPKSGQCLSQIHSSSEPCIADYPGCRFDSECSDDEKCCKNDKCGYGECKSSIPKLCTLIGCGPEPSSDCKNVKEVRPNGEGCGPACRVCDDSINQTKSDMACPTANFPFIFPPSEPNIPVCEFDSDCTTHEKCCYWGGANQCKLGLVKAPKPGSCPAVNLDSFSPHCKMDFSGCSYDSECSGDRKCCKVNGCHYSECDEPTPSIRLVSPPPPASPPAAPSQLPKMCTRRGCGAPQAGPDCKEVEIFLPNGEGCAPQCRVCMDRPPTPPKACTEIGCGPKPGRSCKKIKRVRPNGKGCGPVCKVCADAPAKKTLACPSYPFWFSVPVTKPECESDDDCKPSEKCCRWGAGNQCKPGVDTTPRDGTCPVSLVESERDCKMDFPGCDHDSQCKLSEKCCSNSVCGYKECKTLVPARDYVSQLRLLMIRLKSQMASLLGYTRADAGGSQRENVTQLNVDETGIASVEG